MKKIAYVCILTMLCTLLFAGCGNKNRTNLLLDPNNLVSGTHYVRMDIKDYGSLYLKLDADVAPATVTNFIWNVNNGFYNGLTFHRVVDGFMIQGGDPLANGSGVGAYDLPGEFAANGVENSISHVRGTISMARLDNDYNSASCQFFIMQEDFTDLDGLYAAFGTVVHGMDYVDAICSNVPVIDENGFVSFDKQPVISSAVILTEAEFKTLEKNGFKTPDNDTDEDEVPYAVKMEMTSADHGKETVATWNLSETAEHYLFSCTTDLANVAIYNFDLVTMSFDKDAPLASYKDLKAGELIDICTLVPEGIPSQILLVTKTSGTSIRYMISYEGINGGAELAPLDDPTVK